jgi:DNA primase
VQYSNSIDFDKIRYDIPLLPVVEGAWGSADNHSGDWHMWCCRWHNDKTPSFGVNESTQSFCCYGNSCGKTGDVVDFHFYDNSFRDRIEAARDLLGYYSNGNGNMSTVAPIKDVKRTTGDKEDINIIRQKIQGLDIEYKERLWNKEYSFYIDWIKTQWGIDDKTIARFNLGVCPRVGTLKVGESTPSITFPYYWGVNGDKQLIHIKHRLLEPNGQGKYLPERSGLRTAIFNAQRLQQELPFLLVVEGEAKPIKLEEVGYPAVGVPGANIFKKFVNGEWGGNLFHKAGLIFFVSDPGAEEETLAGAMAVAKTNDVRFVACPVKPDDWFVKYGGSKAAFTKLLRRGRVL